MNLFVLVAVPLSVMVLHRWLYPARDAFHEPKSWILGSVFGILSLIAIAPFGALRAFNGNLVEAAMGLVFTDAFLVPGLVVLAWLLVRPRRETWDLALWLALVFTMAGIRDFAATSRSDDLNEFFLVPLDRILILALLPALVAAAVQSSSRIKALAWSLAAALVVLTGPLFQVLSFAGWGWLVWCLLAATLAAGLWFQKKSRSPGSDSSTQPYA